jgi:hypothetical protein
MVLLIEASIVDLRFKYRVLAAYTVRLTTYVKKDKVIPLQVYGAQRVLGKLRLPDSVTSALESGRLSAIRTGRLYPRSILVLNLRG